MRQCFVQLSNKQKAQEEQKDFRLYIFLEARHEQSYFKVTNAGLFRPTFCMNMPILTLLLFRLSNKPVQCGQERVIHKSTWCMKLGQNMHGKQGLSKFWGFPFDQKICKVGPKVT